MIRSSSCSTSTTRCSTTTASAPTCGDHLEREFGARLPRALLGDLRGAARGARLSPTTSAPCSATGSSTRTIRDLLAMSSFLVDYPFADRLYPGCARRPRALRSLGPDGDPVRRRRRVPAAQGPALGPLGRRRRQRADLHPQGAGARRRRAALSGRALRAGRRQAAHPDGVKRRLGRARDHRLPAPGPLRARPEDRGQPIPPADVTIERIGDLLDYDLRRCAADGPASATMLCIAEPRSERLQ